MNDSEIDTAPLLHENRRLRQTLNDLLDALENEPAVSIDVAELRRRAPDRPGGDRETPDPPWEREGYESKQAWLDDKRSK